MVPRRWEVKGVLFVSVVPPGIHGLHEIIRDFMCVELKFSFLLIWPSRWSMKCMLLVDLVPEVVNLDEAR